MDNILLELKRRGCLGYKLATDSYKIWVVDSYDRPYSLRCDTEIEAWQSFIRLQDFNVETFTLRERAKRAMNERVRRVLSV